jgi:hypothetical protein
MILIQLNKIITNYTLVKIQLTAFFLIFPLPNVMKKR